MKQAEQKQIRVIEVAVQYSFYYREISLFRNRIDDRLVFTMIADGIVGWYRRTNRKWGIRHTALRWIKSGNRSRKCSLALWLLGSWIIGIRTIHIRGKLALDNEAIRDIR